jgi:hypothetical protein
MADAILVLIFLFLSAAFLRPGQSRIFHRRQQADTPTEGQT